MNDDEKKPVAPEGGDDAKESAEDQQGSKVEVKFDTSSQDSDMKDDDKLEIVGFDDTDKKDTQDVPTDDALAQDDEPDEELSDEERALDRIEGIESDDVAKSIADDKNDESTESGAVTQRGDDDSMSLDDITGPVDMESTKSVAETEVADASKESPLVAVMRKQELEKGKDKRGKAGLVAAVLGILLVAALGAGGYFYMQSADTSARLATAESDLSTAQAQNTALAAQAAKATADSKAQQEVAAAEYRILPEIGVRYKETQATKDLVFGYAASPDAAAADAIAISTKQLVKLAVGSGASVAYPCGFTGNVPMISAYTTDAKIGNSTASKVGKKVGNIFVVYTEPTGNCAPTEVAAQTARTAAAKAVYDSLESIPAEGVAVGTDAANPSAATNTQQNTSPSR